MADKNLAETIKRMGLAHQPASALGITANPYEQPEKPESLEEAIVFSSGNEVFVLDRDDSAHQIAKRKFPVFALCSHKGGLYDAGEDQKVFETLTGKRIAESVWSGSILALCSHSGQLYYGAEDGRIAEALTGREIAARGSPVIALCSHNGQLYDAGYYNKIFETLTGMEIAARDNWVIALCSHNGQLYDAGFYNQIFETLTGREIAARTSWVNILCSHNGQLYDGGLDCQVFETMAGKEVAAKRDGWVSAMCSHNGKLYEGRIDKLDANQKRDGFILVSYMHRKKITLYYGCKTGVSETLTGREVASQDGVVWAMCTHPRKYFVEMGILK